MTREDVAEYRMNLENDINIANAFKKLKSNTEFKLILETAYFEQEALSLVTELANHSKDSLEYSEISDRLLAISLTKKYLNQLISKGQMAEADLKELKLIPDQDFNYE